MQLDREKLLAEAVHAAGSDDFGDDAFLPGLDALIAAIGDDGAIPDGARASVRAQLVGPLTRRLQLYHDRARYPEISRQELAAPLIVIGLPRSGTTFLHALLAQDPAARSPLAWQIADPSPPPRQETLDSDPRIAAIDAAQAALPAEFRSMHMIGARLPDECNAFTTMSFLSPNFAAGLHVPSYVAWFMAADARAGYETHRHTLQHLQAFTAGEHWALKAPPHMFHLPELIETYPDARIVFPHRDPAETLPSLTSLIALIRGWTYGQVDRADIGREQLDMWAEAMDRALAFRRDPAQAHRFVDVSYRALIADPLGQVARIYEHFGMPLGSDAEAAIARFVAEAPKDKLGTHRYTLEEAGLTREAVHERFATYLDVHGKDIA